MHCEVRRCEDVSNVALSSLIQSILILLFDLDEIPIDSKFYRLMKETKRKRYFSALIIETIKEEFDKIYLNG